MSKLEFIRNEKLLLADIHDECFQLTRSILHIPLMIKGKQVLGKKAMERILQGKKPADVALVNDLEDLINSIFIPFMQTVLSKQFPKYTLTPYVNEKVINIIPTENTKSDQGEIFGFPNHGLNTYVIKINLYFVYNWVTPKDIIDTLFHELIHFCQKMLAPEQTTNISTPPRLRFSDKAFSINNLYSGWQDGSPASKTMLAKYEHKPDEIEANLYQTLYRVLNVKSTGRFTKGFSVVDRICKTSGFTSSLSKLLSQSTNPTFTEDTLLVIIADAFMKDPILTKAYKSLRAFSSGPALDFLDLPTRRKDPLPSAEDVKKRNFYRKVVDNFIQSNIDLIVGQIKLNLAYKVPGLAEFIG